MTRLITDVLDESPDDEKESQLQKMPRSVAREVRREAKYYQQLLPQLLASAGYDHWLRKEARPDALDSLLTGKQSRQMVKIRHVAYNQTNIFLQIDPLRLPYRITVPMLKDPDILETLSLGCGRKVTFALHDYKYGAWFVIHREGIISNIPTKFSFKDAVLNIPKTQGALRYCAGVTENMRLVIPNIERMPHLLIAGATGYGKSVHLNSVICQLLWRNSPDVVKFLMIDLKGGMELVDYAGSGFLWRDIVTDIPDVVEALRAYKEEMFRRQELFAGTARTLTQYNNMHKDKLPFIILVIDELAMVLKHPDSKMSNEAMLELGQVLNISRATGGHCIVCTQRPSADVVSGYIKANISSRVAFRTATKQDSRVILDTSHAETIEIPGRAWMLDGAQRVQIQTPWISPRMIRQIIREVAEREKPADPGIGIIQIAEVSLSELGGSLSSRQLYDAMRGKIGKSDLEDILSQSDHEIIHVHGLPYEIIPGNGGAKPRRLARVAKDGDQNAW